MREPSSAIRVRIGLPPPLERVRRRLDFAAVVGVPPHVTILYPWSPPGWLTGEARASLSRIAGETRSFDVRFVAARRWPGIVYLEPEPAARFAALAMAAATEGRAGPPSQTVISSRCSPQALRRRLLISPTVA